MLRRIPGILLFCLFLSKLSLAQTPHLQEITDSLRKIANFPGLSVAIVYKDNTSVSFVSGYNDKEKNILLKKSDGLMQGSVGKTYVSAIALQLIKEDKIDLEEKVSKYLGHYKWYNRVPNAATITVKMIMNHTSGVMRYEFKDQFTRDLTGNPGKVWKPADLLEYILDEKPSFAAGEGWEYSDTNYILLGMIIEEVTRKKYYDLLRERILEPLKLGNTFPSDGRQLKRLAQGYAGNENVFGGKDKVIDDNGLFIINPQFEWTGGGIYSTTEDLARWGKMLYELKAFDSSMLNLALNNAVPAKLGKDMKYGLGVIIRQTPIGVAYGHSGFFPGYMTEMLYFPEYKICIAVQINGSDYKNYKTSVVRCLLEIAKLAKDKLP
jgi:D-alanyl-D-alanine carboxypeptidase